MAANRRALRDSPKHSSNGAILTIIRVFEFPDKLDCNKNVNFEFLKLKKKRSVKTPICEVFFFYPSKQSVIQIVQGGKISMFTDTFSVVPKNSKKKGYDTLFPVDFIGVNEILIKSLFFELSHVVALFK